MTIRIRLFRNFGWKLGGVVLALALWFHLTTQKYFTQTVTVPIDYQNVAFGLEISQQSPRTVELEIAGSGRQLFQLIYLKPLRLTIDVGKYRAPGRYSVELSREHLGLPAGMEDVRTAFLRSRVCEFELVSRLSIDVSPGN